LTKVREIHRDIYPVISLKEWDILNNGMINSRIKNDKKHLQKILDFL